CILEIHSTLSTDIRLDSSELPLRSSLQAYSLPHQPSGNPSPPQAARLHLSSSRRNRPHLALCSQLQGLSFQMATSRHRTSTRPNQDNPHRTSRARLGSRHLQRRRRSDGVASLRLCRELRTRSGIVAGTLQLLPQSNTRANQLPRFKIRLDLLARFPN